MSEAQDKKIDELEREIVGQQEMLYHILTAVGEPVVVPKSTLKKGIVGDKMIWIDENVDEDAFIFSIRDMPDEQ